MCKAYIIFLIKTIVDYRVTVNLARLFLWSSLVAQRSSWQPCQSNYPRRRGVNFWKRLKMLNTRKTLTTRMSMTIKLFKFNHSQLVDDVSVWVNYSWEYWTMKLLNLKKIVDYVCFRDENEKLPTDREPETSESPKL